MATLRLFASVREAAGEREVTIPGDTVGEVIATSIERFGEHFGELVGACRVWVDGEPATDETPVDATAEVAVLPPVSGG